MLPDSKQRRTRVSQCCNSIPIDCTFDTEYGALARREFVLVHGDKVSCLSFVSGCSSRLDHRLSSTDQHGSEPRIYGYGEHGSRNRSGLSGLGYVDRPHSKCNALRFGLVASLSTSSASESAVTPWISSPTITPRFRRPDISIITYRRLHTP